MKSSELVNARINLDAALNNIEAASRAHTEAQTTLHMAGLKLREAQKYLRSCIHVFEDLVNGGSHD